MDMKELKQSVMDFAAGMAARKLNIFAASGCYYLFLSLVPIIMILCCILPYTPLSRDVVMRYVDLYFNSALALVVHNIVSTIYRSDSAALTISIVLTLFSASASMRALMAGMDAAYGYKKKSGFILYYLRALFYMVILFATLLASMIVLVYGGHILRLLRAYMPHLTIFNRILSGTRYVMVFGFLLVIFTLLYTVMPSARIPLLQQLPGAIFSAVVWIGFSYGFTIYLNYSDKFGAFGIIGTVMISMMWIYYCLYFLLIGGYLNSYFMEKRSSL